VFEVTSQGVSMASREQIPLTLAWAVTIHKSQGTTLSKVEVSLGSAFEYGQSYVALSRVRCIEGLRLLDFNATRVRAHPLALAFYRAMEAEATT
jgi:ATP-dependent DNA helicase PIF1